MVLIFSIDGAQLYRKKCWTAGYTSVLYLIMPQMFAPRKTLHKEGLHVWDALLDYGCNHHDIDLKALLQNHNSTETSLQYQKNLKDVIESPNKTQYENISELQTFLGMMVYFSSYIPFYA
ncbi:hypothetical protein C8R44DRAFT_748241 [Mycena epipterygia]|nr:hypothetical protein C8R44DRAFT_748241 [Mycena epipterygia]